MSTISRYAILTAVCAITLSCTPSPALLKTQAAGHTGCVPDAIEVSGLQPVRGGYMWNATCGGTKYLCTDLMSGKNSAEVSCASAAQQ